MTSTLTKAGKAKPGSIDWELVISLYQQGLDGHDIERETGIKRQTINVGLCKRGITKLPRNREPDVDTEALSRVTREKLARKADKLAEALGEPPKSLERQVLYADVLQKTTKAAGTLHGWDLNGSVALVVPGLLTLRPADHAEPPAIDVESVESGTSSAPNDHDQPNT